MLPASFHGSSFQTWAGTNGGGNRRCILVYPYRRGELSGPFQSNAGRDLPHPANNKRKRSGNSSSDLRQSAPHEVPEVPEPFHRAPVLPLQSPQWRCMPWPVRITFCASSCSNHCWHCLNKSISLPPFHLLSGIIFSNKQNF